MKKSRYRRYFLRQISCVWTSLYAAAHPQAIFVVTSPSGLPYIRHCQDRWGGIWRMRTDEDAMQGENENKNQWWRHQEKLGGICRMRMVLRMRWNQGIMTTSWQMRRHLQDEDGWEGYWGQMNMVCRVRKRPRINEGDIRTYEEASAGRGWYWGQMGIWYAGLDQGSMRTTSGQMRRRLYRWRVYWGQMRMVCMGSTRPRIWGRYQDRWGGICRKKIYEESILAAIDEINMACNVRMRPRINEGDIRTAEEALVGWEWGCIYRAPIDKGIGR